MKKIFYNCVIRNKKIKILFFIALTMSPCAHGMDKIQRLRRAVSEGTGPDGIMIRPKPLFISDSPRTNSGPLSLKQDDSRRSTERWQALEILDIENNLPEFEYDEKRKLYVTSPVSRASTFSPDEAYRTFPATIDAHLEKHALVLDFPEGKKYLYLPGTIKQDDNLRDYGYFEYRLIEEQPDFGSKKTICNYRKFNLVSADDFFFDDRILQTFDEKSPIKAPNPWNEAEINNIFIKLGLIKKLLQIQQNERAAQGKLTFQDFFLRNMLTLLIAQTTLHILPPDLERKVISYQRQIDASKASIFNTTGFKHDEDIEKELQDQVNIIDRFRNLQTTALLEVLEKNNRTYKDQLKSSF